MDSYQSALPEEAIEPGDDLVEIAEPPPLPPAKIHKPTEFALRAMSLADEFKQVCGLLRLVGPMAIYHVELTAPDGPSTGGGKQSVQHLKLVPNTGSTTIVIGQANQIERECELRDYDCLSQYHALRFKGRPLPFSRDAYESLRETVGAFFAQRRLAVTVVSTARQTLPSIAGVDPRARRRWGTMVAAALAIAVVVVALLRHFHS